MKKIPHLLAAAAFAAFGANAGAEPSFYIGGGMNNGSADHDIALNSSGGSTIGKSSWTGDSSGGTFKLGFITDGGNRAEFSYSSIDIKWNGGGKDRFSGIDFDFLITFGGNIKPYIDLGVGAYQLKDTGQFIVGGQDLSGGALNLGVGVLIDVGANLDIEAAYKYKMIAWNDLKDSVGRILESNSSVSGVYLGLNLKF